MRQVSRRCRDDGTSYLVEHLVKTEEDLPALAAAFVGMDDTSTTTISPAMFEACNLALTDQRADLCHRAGKLYWDLDAVRAGIRDFFARISPATHIVLNLAAYPHKTIEQHRFVVEECRKYAGTPQR